MNRDATVFDDVNWHPGEWRFYTKGTVIAADDLGAFTYEAPKDGWYYVEPQKLGDAQILYMPPEFEPSWMEKQ